MLSDESYNNPCPVYRLCIGCISAVYRLDFLESFICLFEWEKRSLECMWISIFIMLMGIFNMNIIYFSHLVHILLMFCKVNQFSHFTSNKYIIFITKLWFSLRNLIKIKNKIFYHKCSVMYIFDKNVYTFLENHPQNSSLGYWLIYSFVWLYWIDGFFYPFTFCNIFYPLLNSPYCNQIKKKIRFFKEGLNVVAIFRPYQSSQEEEL